MDANVKNEDFESYVKNMEEKIKGKFKKIRAPEDVSKLMLETIQAMLRKDRINIPANSIDELYVKLLRSISMLKCDVAYNLYSIIMSLNFFKSKGIDCEDLEKGVLELVKYHGYDSIEDCFKDVKRKIILCASMRSVINMLNIYFGYYTTKSDIESSGLNTNNDQQNESKTQS